jgi:transposase
MKRMSDYDLVRRLFYRQGVGKREISRRTGIHRETIEKMLRYASPPGYRLSKPRSKTKLDPYIHIIDQILKDDRKAPKKQRHTAKRILDRLKEEYGFTGGYTIVKDYVREMKGRMREVFFPLEQRPGTSQVDFGQAKVIIGGVEGKAHIFCMALPFSDALFVRAYPTEAIEAVQDGHNSAYAFFKGVVPTALYDNMSTAVKIICKGKTGDLTDDFKALRSHYLFESFFCNIGRPNEKGLVEEVVGYARRNFLVPVPRVNSWDELNSYLQARCIKRLSMKAAGKELTIGELLEQERPMFLPLPDKPYDACRTEHRRASSLSLVRFQNNSYSVPVEYAYQEVTVKAYVHQVKICHKDEVIAAHQRCYEKDEFIFEPLHYLPLLERKPKALDGAMPFIDWELPKCFETLRRYLEARNGNPGKREYILILQLLRDYGIPEVRRAVERAFEYNAVNFESIRLLIMSGRDPSFEAVRLSEERLGGLPRINIDDVDISCYQELIAGERL